MQKLKGCLGGAPRRALGSLTALLVIVLPGGERDADEMGTSLPPAEDV